MKLNDALIESQSICPSTGSGLSIELFSIVTLILKIGATRRSRTGDLLITNRFLTVATAYTSLQNPTISSPRGQLIRLPLGPVCSWSRTKLGQ